MTTKRFRVHTGPCAVSETATVLREVGATDIIEGTEHVHFTWEYVGGIDAALPLHSMYRDLPFEWRWIATTAREL